MKVIPHQGQERRKHSFDEVWEYLNKKGEHFLTTSTGTNFSAKSSIATKGAHRDERVIVFYQNRIEYARCYKCCWEHYYNCNRTRTGMYSQALDLIIE